MTYVTRLPNLNTIRARKAHDKTKWKVERSKAALERAKYALRCAENDELAARHHVEDCEAIDPACNPWGASETMTVEEHNAAHDAALAAHNA